MFSFTGSRGSILGEHNFYGKGAVGFYTQWKTVTSNWKLDDSDELSLSMPFVTTHWFLCLFVTGAAARAQQHAARSGARAHQHRTHFF